LIYGDYDDDDYWLLMMMKTSTAATAMTMVTTRTFLSTHKAITSEAYFTVLSRAVFLPQLKAYWP